FTSDDDPTSSGSAGVPQVYKIHSDGTGLVQLTDPFLSPYATEPYISANGSVVVFRSGSGSTGLDVMAVNANGSNLHNITSGNYNWRQDVDDSGTWITFMSNGNLTGQSPNGRYQIYRVHADGTGLQRVSTDATRDEIYPEISGTGTRIVYISSADP